MPSYVKHLYYYKGKTSNVYIVVGPDGTYLIDSGMPSDVPILQKILEHFPPLKRALFTHFHVDHISGWMLLEKRFKGVEAFFHENARPLLYGKKRVPFPPLRAWKDILVPCMREYGYVLGARDVIYGMYGTPFRKGMALKNVQFFTRGDNLLPGFRMIHTPGHTPDSVSFHHPEKGILISGDFILVLNGKISANTFLQNCYDQESSLGKIRKLDRLKTICPGHGPFAQIKQECDILSMPSTRTSYRVGRTRW